MTDKWMKRYPSAIVNRETDGDREYAKTFKGEADKLLYQLKNLMRFRNLGQSKMTRIFTDGTVVTARSVFGRDNVIVDTSRSTAITAVSSCSITLIDAPDSVIPMQYSGEVHAGEEEGVDYIKMYYTTLVSDCADCESDVEWTLETITTHSLDNHTWAEVIEQDEDEDGTYIIWKAYTEESEFSRSGLATLNITGVIKDADGGEVCTVEHEVSVDCCEKEEEDREVAILASQADMLEWDEECAEEWCKVPEELPGKALNKATTFKSRTDDEEIVGYGSCLDYEWALSGSGALEATGDFSEESTYTPPEAGNCENDITISLKDRCDSEFVAHRLPCCDDAEAVVMSYASLLMSCDAEQTLSVTGGCRPYTWEIVSGVGEIEAGEGEDDNEAVYTSPSANPDCNNPVIKVTDCCGNSDEITITINCTGGVAGYYTQWVLQRACPGFDAPGEEGNPCGYTAYEWYIFKYYFLCDGTIDHQNLFIGDTLSSDPYTTVEERCVPEPSVGPYTRCNDEIPYCWVHDQDCWYHLAPWWGGFVPVLRTVPSDETFCHGYTEDLRTEQQKAAGCCPPQLA